MYEIVINKNYLNLTGIASLISNPKHKEKNKDKQVSSDKHITPVFIHAS